jgi:alanine racemase
MANQRSYPLSHGAQAAPPSQAQQQAPLSVLISRMSAMNAYGSCWLSSAKTLTASGAAETAIRFTREGLVLRSADSVHPVVAHA